MVLCQMSREAHGTADTISIQISALDPILRGADSCEGVVETRAYAGAPRKIVTPGNDRRILPKTISGQDKEAVLKHT